MPKMNGKELADSLQLLLPELKVLFMSGYTANAIAHGHILDEGVSFLQKPYSMNELTDTIKAVMDKHS